MDINVVCNAVKRYAKVTMNYKDDLEVGEVCDFGDSYGFSFITVNKYNNPYWLVNKKTSEITTFLPVQDTEKFKSRKILKFVSGKGLEKDEERHL